MPVPPDTARLRFREMEASDLRFMASLLGDERVMRFYPRPKSRQEARAWIEWNRRLYRTRGFGLWLIELADSREPVGDCGLTPQVVDGVEEVELGYHVHPDFQGRGLATEAAIAVREHARSALGQPRVVAIVDPRNEPSRRVARRVGLRLEKAALWAGKPVVLYATRPEELRRELSSPATPNSPRPGHYPQGRAPQQSLVEGEHETETMTPLSRRTSEAAQPNSRG